MRRLARALLALAAIAIASRARAVQVDVLEPQREYRLAKLRIVGAHGVKPRTLRDVMLTKARPWFAVWRAYPTFDPVTFRTDLERIRRTYEDRGYYSAVVEHDVELPASGDAVTAVVYVDEGAPVVVEGLDVDLTGEALPPAKRAALLASLPLKRGGVLTADAYTRTEATLRAYYREHGYARVETTRTATVDAAAATADVRYRVVSGPPMVFGDTRIDGTKRLTRGIIRRELAYEPGDKFRQSRLDKTRENLVALNLLRTVRIDEEPKPDDRVDLHVRVDEAPPREIRLGVGYDTEEQVRGLASWRTYDFLGGARQLGVSARVSIIRRTLAADFLQPHFPGQNNRTRLIFTEDQDDEDSFDLDRTRLEPRFEWKATERITGFAFWRGEYDSLSHVRRAIRDYNPDLAPSNATLSGMGFGADWNATDDLLDPTRGFVATGSVEPVGGPLGGDISLLRLVGQARLYQPLVGKLLGAARLRLGAAEPTDGTREIPLYERFYAGGINSVRGYGRWRIGRLIHDHPIGGRTLVETSVELRHPVTERVAAAVFLDGGEVSEQSWKFRFGHLRYGTGVGAIVKSPIGPLRFDLGFPVQPPDGDQRWQVHVSLGGTF